MDDIPRLRGARVMNLVRAGTQQQSVKFGGCCKRWGVSNLPHPWGEPLRMTQDTAIPRCTAPLQGFEAAHQQALAAGEKHYTDPKTGYMVWTELHHLERGSCCQCSCRHCPYGFAKQA